MNKIIFLLLLSTAAAGQNIDSLVKQRVDFRETPGIVLGIYSDGKISYYNHGVANVATGEKVSPQTLFEIGSITKTFTTLLAALLVNQAAISLDDPLQKYMPENIKVPSKDGHVITLLDLATARSGLPRMPYNLKPANPANPYIDYSPDDLYDFFNGFSLTRNPGNLYEYSNLGMGLLGYALTLQTHKPYRTLVEEMITRPLQMDHTMLSVPNKNQEHTALGYIGNTHVPAWTWNDESIMAGAGGLISNAGDMMKFIVANLQEPATPLGKAMKLTHQRRFDAGAEHVEIGLGWHITNSKVVWHDGATSGFRSFVGFNTESKTAVVILGNSNITASDLGFYLLDNTLPLKKLVRPLTVAPAILASYAGEYELAPQFKINISVKEGALFCQATGQGEFELFAQSETKFFLKVVNAQVEFVKNDTGRIEKLVLYQNGMAQPAKKIK